MLFRSTLNVGLDDIELYPSFEKYLSDKLGESFAASVLGDPSFNSRVKESVIAMRREKPTFNQAEYLMPDNLQRYGQYFTLYRKPSENGEYTYILNLNSRYYQIPADARCASIIDQEIKNIKFPLTDAIFGAKVTDQSEIPENISNVIDDYLAIEAEYFYLEDDLEIEDDWEEDESFEIERDDPLDGDAESALWSIGWGNDEDYGYYEDSF